MVNGDVAVSVTDFASVVKSNEAVLTICWVTCEIVKVV